MERKIRIVMAKPGLDGHDRGIKVLAAAYRDAGMEVIYLGLRQTTASIIAAAEEEDADAIGLSMHNAGHLTLGPKMAEALSAAGLDIPLIIGGIVPDEDVEELMNAGIAAVLVFILVLQPDIGMTSVIVLTWGFQMFLAGMPMLLVLISIALAPLCLYAAYLFLPHVEKRIDRFFDGGTMQTTKSIESFSQGGFFGVGPGDGQVKLNLPDAHADFIFSVAAEEYGVLACLFLIGLYSFFLLRGFERSAIGASLFNLLAGAGLIMQFTVHQRIEWWGEDGKPYGFTPQRITNDCQRFYYTDVYTDTWGAENLWKNMFLFDCDKPNFCTNNY